MYIHLESALFLYFFVQLCSPAQVRITFEKCDLKGFTCVASPEVSGRHDITFQCTNVTGQDIQFYLWAFSAPGTIQSLTLHNCEKVQLSLTCSGDNRPIQWVKFKNIGSLEWLPPNVPHNPPKMIFENISRIEILPRQTFAQIKKIFYKPGCYLPAFDLNALEFRNVNFGTIESGAFDNLSDMTNFEWTNVTVSRIAYAAMKMQFVQGGKGSISNSNLGVLEPMALQFVGDGLSIKNNKIEDLSPSSINGTVYDFEFVNNTVDNLQSSAIAVLSQNTYINNNHFRNVESGAFKKVSPGLLHDSQRNFGTLYFVYDFNNNLFEHVEDKGIRPDIEAYKNVASLVNFTENTLQCSCETISWLGAEVDLGFNYTVLKDFNTMILDPKNKNNCNFNPCMCFGVRSPNKRSSATAAVF
ncbi:hypothetical protein PPYR_10256 [Photinus pyralis]|uniref:Right handed beta helix domain-containing protein n=1 Tax=Photinus pyralis TaxID=7054 RepID=A0A5N4AFU0_PHOPY|nr:uncharacterized protein LOC116173527 [Photinus pyralis]KAB0796195.1 hypothetical protein PPYR_10256 [Photinus pyralis]